MSAQAGGRRRLLFVATTTERAATAKAALDERGFAVETAVGTAEALDSEFDVDGIVCTLSEEGRRDLLAAVRGRDNEVPVVVVVDGAASASDALVRGATDYLLWDGQELAYDRLASRLRTALETASQRTDNSLTADRADELHRQKAKIKALHGVSTDIEECETTDEVYERIVDAAESILDFDIAIADAVEDGVLVPKAVSSTLSEDHYYDETPIDEEDSIAARVYREGTTEIVDDVRERAADPASVEFRSGLTVPIGEYGIFQTVDKSVGAFDKNDRELAELLVTHAKEQLRQIHREQELEAQTEQLRRQNERLDKFTSIVSHDLRNPLNVAKSYLELAGDSCDAPELDEVDAALDRMDQLITDLLTLARQGDFLSDVDTVDLTDVVEASWQNVETDAAALVVETTQTIQADHQRLTQLLENLFRNAVEHGAANTNEETTQPSVTVTVGDLEDGFYVADDGPGLPEVDREQLFEMGYSTADRGTGLGLNIVKEVATAHGWEVTATDSETGGARFEITGV